MTLRTYNFHQVGCIDGIPGTFAGCSVTIDVEARHVVAINPLGALEPDEAPVAEEEAAPAAEEVAPAEEADAEIAAPVEEAESPVEEAAPAAAPKKAAKAK